MILIKPILFLLIYSLAYSKVDQSESLKLKYVQSLVVDTNIKFENTKLGGFSGLIVKDSNFFVISDDRGRYGDPRIYRFSFQQTANSKFELMLKEKILIFKKSKKIKVFDFEALAAFGSGWLLSTEGDWNAKPLAPPEVFLVQEGKTKKKVIIPDEFLPKFKGKQTSGLYNNKAFEGIHYDELTGQLYLLSESGLVQKQDGDRTFYLLEYLFIKGNFDLNKTSKLDFSNNIDVGNLYNGATDILKLSDNSFLILTRSVQSALSLQYSNNIWLLNRNSFEDQLRIVNGYAINEKNPATEELNQNFEGMAILNLNDKKYLVLVSDDNFNSFEKTVFSFFELEVK